LGSVGVGPVLLQPQTTHMLFSFLFW
jgi:hypothetical protein